MTDTATMPPQRPAPDLESLGLLSGLPAALAAGRDRDLLEPLRFVTPGTVPALAPRSTDRRALAAALAATNRSWGHPRARELAAKLADPETRVVVTGQQPGLFGGPLLVAVKAAAAVKWAAALEASGQPAVAVFWVATEDHDFAEVASSTVLGPAGPHTASLGPDPAPLVPVGLRALGAEVDRLLAELTALSGAPGWAEHWQALATWYRPASRIGDAFFRALIHLLGERSPLVLDAEQPELKLAERPWLERLVRQRAELTPALAAADERVLARGYRLQVAPQPGLAPLFLLRDGVRRRIEWRGEDAWTLRGTDLPPQPVAELLAILADNPAVASPGVLARPAIQDAALGTALFVVGPGELSYLAQGAATHATLGIEAPAVALRPQALVLEEKHCTWLSELGLGVEDLFAPRTALDHKLALRRGEDPVAPLRAEFGAKLTALRERALASDPTLEAPWQKTRDQIDRALATFGDKLAAAAARGDEVAHRRLDQILALTRPEGAVQERKLAAAFFAARYGDRFRDALFEQLDLDPRTLQVVSL